MSSHGFTVTPHYLGLATAWRASFKHGTGGPVLGVNSEMDALPGIGHACGHNLIAIAGVGTALGIKAAMEAHDIAGEVVLLGTPGMWRRLYIHFGSMSNDHEQPKKGEVAKSFCWNVVGTTRWMCASCGHSPSCTTILP